MSRISLLWLFSLCALRLCAQEIQLNPEMKCSIEGQVVRAGTGEPLKKARVMLRQAEGRGQPDGTATDAGGHFALKDIDPGRYILWVERNGYVHQQYGQRSGGRSGTILTLEKGQKLRDVLFRLIPAGVIAGRVVDDDREPLPGVQVQALQYRYIGGKQQLVFTVGASTNDFGEYRLYGLAPGRYYLSATYRPGATFYGGSSVFMNKSESEVDEGYATTYYPGTQDMARATLLELRAGEEVGGTDFVLLATRTVRVRGRVFNSIAGGSLQRTTVSLMPRERAYGFFSAENRASVEDAQGKFELRGVTPGSYTISAMWWQEGKTYAARQPLDVGSVDVQGINLVIGPGTDLAGRVAIEGAANISLTSLNVYLQPSEIGIPTGGSASVKPDGTFLLQNVADDKYRIFVFQLPPDFYLKAARLGTDDVLEKGLTINRDQELGRLELIVSSAAGQIEGQVLTEEQLPANGSIVALIPEQRRRNQTWLFKNVTTDQFGRFTLRGIAPGEYKLFAWNDIEPGAYQDPDFLRRYEEKGKLIHIDEASRITAELKLIAVQAQNP